MGTSYKLSEQNLSDDLELMVIVEIDEQSNHLSLSITTPTGYTSTPDMSPVQMLQLLMEGIKATSYWMERKEFEEAFSNLQVYPY